MNREQRLAMAAEHGITTQGQFEEIVDELATTRLEKVIAYGEDRYNEADADFDRIMLYSDIYRKFIRLKQQLYVAPPSDMRKVVSDLFDLSGYGLMGVQLLRGVVRAAPALPAPAPFRAAKREALPQLEQVAFVTREEAGARALVEMFGLLGATEWVEDEVTAIGTVRGTPHCTNTAHLRFNYQLIKGIELEVLTYTAGRNWHESRWVNMDTVVAFSHIGVHVEDIVAVTNQMIDLGLTVAQQVTTSKHTNPAIAGKRTYKYVVFDSRGMLGFDLKLIQRIT